MATSIIRPVHAGIDVPYDLPIDTNEWIESGGRYVHAYTDNRITTGCRVEVTFKGGTLNTDVLYIEFEKITNGINFIVSEIPEVAVPIIIHIINAQTGTVLIPNADQVATVGTAQALGANVNNALINISDELNNVYDKVTDYLYRDLTTKTLSRVKSYNRYASRIFGKFIWVQIYFLLNSDIAQSSSYETFAELDVSDCVDDDEVLITGTDLLMVQVPGAVTGSSNSGNSVLLTATIDSNTTKIAFKVFQYGKTTAETHVRYSGIFPYKRKILNS